MPPPRSYSITRPRPLLSCLRCRQRKVKCNREHPSCSDCLKINHPCQYDSKPSTKYQTGKESSDQIASDARSSTGLAHALFIERRETYQSQLDQAEKTTQAASTVHRDTEENGVNVAHSIKVNLETAASTQKRLRLLTGSLSHRRETETSPVLSRKVESSSTIAQVSENGDHNRGRLNAQSGGQMKFVGGGFWGFVKGHELLCDSLLIEAETASTGISPPHYIDQPALASLLGTLPSKNICDIFLYSFSIGVRPIVPLFHMPSFTDEYNDYWKWITTILAGSFALPNLKHLDDPTFMCLFFSVIYCGAATASCSIWKATTLKDVNKEEIIAQLHQSFVECQRICQHTRHPTQNTLVASLLAHECSTPGRDGAHDQDFIYKVLRIAQGIGLHRDRTLFSLDPISIEIRRRIWWHIIWLDVRISIQTGLPTLCNPGRSQQDVRMVTETRDEDLVAKEPAIDGVNLQASPKISSAIIFLANGQYETARFEHALVNFCNGTRNLDQTRFDEFVESMRKLYLRIEDLISNIPAQGIPEKGFIPFRFTSADPLANEELYNEKSSAPTVFTAWARILLTMLKAESSLLLQKCLLGSGKLSKESTKIIWDGIIRDSSSYLQNYLQLNSTPSFEPYTWCLPNHRTPLQCVFLILVYMHSNRDSPTSNLLRYFTDELLDLFAPEAIPASNATKQKTIKTDTETAAAWGRVRAIRTKLDLLSNPSLLSDFNDVPASGDASFNLQAANAPSSVGTSSRPGNQNEQPEFNGGLDISELVSWLGQ